MSKATRLQPSTAGARTVSELIGEKAELNADKVALEFIDSDERRTYSQLAERSDALAAGLEALGLGAGDRGCVLMANSADFVDAWLAMAKVGLIEVPINTANRGDSLRYILQDSGARVVICDHDFVERITSILDDCPDLDHLVVAGGSSAAAAAATKRVSSHLLADLYLSSEPARRSPSPDQPAVILYTSGTTGPPKGVVLPDEFFNILGRHTAELCGYGGDDRLFTTLPLFHVAAKCTCLMAGLASDATVVLGTRFSASGFLTTVRERKITAFNYQGAILNILMKQPERDDDADNPAQRAYGGGAAPGVWEAFEKRFGLRLIEVYGMTEIGTATASTLDATRVGTCGKPAPHLEVEIQDEAGNLCPPDQAGEIVVRPRQENAIFSEYYGMPDKTRESFRDGWFRTGDRGKADGDGYISFIDRQKDAIRRRGEYVSTFDVERAVNRHPDVLECAAYGVPSELGEEEVMVAVVFKPGQVAAPEALLDICQQDLPYFSVPRYLRTVESLPKTPRQSTKKVALREEGVTADTWDREAAGYELHR